MSDDTVAIWGERLRETSAAVLLRVEGGEEIWFPLSQVEETDDNEWTMPHWLAMKKGVI